MRRFDFRLCSALCAALLLGGVAAWPAVALASTGVGPSATLDQLTGITGAPCPTSGFWGWRPVGCGQPFNAGYPSSFAGTNYGVGYGATPYLGLSGYSSAYSGYGGLTSLGNNYPGAGLAAGSSYPSSVAWGGWGAGYPGSGYSPSSIYGYGAGGGSPYGYNTDGASPGADASYGSSPYGAYGSTADAPSGYAGYVIPPAAAPPAYLLCTTYQDNQPVLVVNGTSTEGYASCTPFIQ